MEQIFKKLSIKTDSKIFLIVLDGIGDLPIDGKTPLEAANTPNLDKLAADSSLGIQDPVYRGITPGSGPGHLSLFGYDPIKYSVGRGILAALGINMELGPDAVAMRGNFATIDENGNVTDRRAGRIPSSLNEQLIEKLSAEIDEIDGVKISLKTVAEYRFAIVLHGKGLGGNVADTDPQKTGVPSLPPRAGDEASEKTAIIIEKFIEKVKEILKDEKPANYALIRGVDKLPTMDSLQSIYKLTPGVIASYPMYRGVAKLVGMDIIGIYGEGELMEEKIQLLEEKYKDYDFIFLHIKKTDSYGEDGNFNAKVHHIEMFDQYLPRILALKPDVLAITGDHSTPVKMKGHSWHGVPVLINSKFARVDGTKRFTELEAVKGSLGRFKGIELMPQLIANAMKFKKFGA